MDSVWSSSDCCSPGSVLGLGLVPGPVGGVTPAAGAEGGGESRPNQVYTRAPTQDHHSLDNLIKL